ncbi:MAG: MGMT family protein [Candidatus Caenarcaniphilales bacterium]|nr:MGMT family protein [Candidatus Caenarcaniphilales bacterium]
MTDLKKAVLEIVSKIPAGKVMYYGQIADMIGITARQVGFIMNGLTPCETNQYPWYRVVAKDGYISTFKLGERGFRHKEILEKEGYLLKEDHVDMNQHLWLFAGIDHPGDPEVQQFSVLIEQLKR